MKSLRWSDNICTVGWTCIHAWMNYEDMEWLHSMHPEGTFTPTFFPPSVFNRHTKRNTASWLEAMKDFKGSRLYAQTILGFYFNFPEDERGKALLVALKLRGMGDRIK